MALAAVKAWAVVVAVMVRVVAVVLMRMPGLGQWGTGALTSFQMGGLFCAALLPCPASKYPLLLFLCIHCPTAQKGSEERPALVGTGLGH